MAADDPLDRALAAWSREDVAAIMRSAAYRESAHPDHAQAQALVRAWSNGTMAAPAGATPRGACANRRLSEPAPPIAWFTSARTCARAARSTCGSTAARGGREPHHLPPEIAAARGPQWWYMSVLILIMIVPVVALAIALERYIRRGMLIGAVKG
jgi:hypothetical protein